MVSGLAGGDRGRAEDSSAWPSLGWEEHAWVSKIPDDLVSTRIRTRHQGPYRAAVVPTIADRTPSLPANVTSLADDASVEIARFDTELGIEVAPFASVLLRSESASSSRIENLTSGAKAIALAELGSTEKRNAAEIVGNVAAMKAALDLADRLDESAVLAMHAALMARHAPGIGGRWRQEQVWIGGDSYGPHGAAFIPPHHRHVPAAAPSGRLETKPAATQTWPTPASRAANSTVPPWPSPPSSILPPNGASTASCTPSSGYKARWHARPSRWTRQHKVFVRRSRRSLAPRPPLCHGDSVSHQPLRLHGQVVTLREFVADDAASALAIVGDPRVTDFLSFDAKNPQQTAAMLDGILTRARQQPRTEFYLATEHDGQLIGFARLGLDGVQAAKLGYAVRADYWGRGYATDAVRTIVTYGFHELGLHRISAAIGPDNTASIAVVKRTGFAHEGRIRDHVHTNGAWRDSLLYSVLAHEWSSEPS
jgi:RimJ/RimL family protein N-acetyltransferase